MALQSVDQVLSLSPSAQVQGLHFRRARAGDPFHLPRLTDIRSRESRLMQRQLSQQTGRTYRHSKTPILLSEHNAESRGVLNTQVWIRSIKSYRYLFSYN